MRCTDLATTSRGRFMRHGSPERLGALLQKGLPDAPCTPAGEASNLRG
jgi:hypothetical protein